jgi:mitochondrial fission protein ELM1
MFEVWLFMLNSQQESLVIWRLLDGKPGHEKQSLGLVKSIQDKVVCDCYDIPVKPQLDAWINYFGSIWPQGNRLPLPDFIIGAGHHTHLHLLAAKKAFGGKTIVMMRPSIPVSMFDLALIPQHDQYQGRGRLIETRGVLNPIKPEGAHHQDHALIMIGGQSRHFEWDNQIVLTQVESLLMQNPSLQFTLTTSRRTPTGFLQLLQQQLTQTLHKQLKIVPVEKTPNGWVEQQLAQSAFAWITEDSVSMVYEALTAQVAVGVINLKIKRENRVANGVKQLLQNNLLVRFDHQGDYKANLRALIGFREADRCANMILNEWHQEKGIQVQAVLA